MTLTDKVRMATRVQHEALDGALLPFLEAIRTKEEYITLLKAFYGFFKPVYDRIDEFIDAKQVPDYAQRRKPGVILDDLHNLGASLELRFCTSIPHISNGMQAMGALYVLEGSTMGGVMIRKMIGDRLNISEGLQFFAGYGRHTREQWMLFIQYLNNLQTDAQEAEDVVQAAAATFTLLKAWLQQADLLSQPNQSAGTFF